MNRRDMLKGSAVIGAAAAATGCVTPGKHPGAMAAAPSSMDEYVARLDADLAGIDAADVRPALRPHLGALADDPRLQDALMADDPLVRKAAKTLYLTAAFRDLPEASRAHPAIQERMLRAAPMMTEAILGMRDRLARLTDAEKRQLQQQLRAQPAMAEAVCRALDQQVDSALIQPERRARQRMVMNSYAWRMEHQSAAAVIDTQLDKANRALRAYAARGEAPVLIPDSPSQQGGADMVGLAMMGIGLVVGVVSVLLFATPAGAIGVIGTTVGGALLLIGLLVFLISTAARANVQPEPDRLPPGLQPGAPSSQPQPAPPPI